MPISLGALAEQFDCELVGDATREVDRVASLSNATEGSLSFLSGAAFKPQLAATKASVVILREADLAECPTAALISDNPYATYARMAAAVVPPPVREPGIHPLAFVDPDATVDPTAHIAAHVAVGKNSTIGPHCEIGPGSVIGENCRLGARARLISNVSLVRDVRVGERCIFHSGAVIGSDGFGNAMTPEGWVKVPQLGGVLIGDDVEVGANTTIDCGAMGDTVIENGVRIDNLVMIAHNVHIGEHTAMAAAVGIAGSAVIGKRCMFAGHSGTVGHITVCDDVILNAQGVITKDVDKPGVYASSFAAEPVAVWNKMVARIRRLDKLVAKVRALEKQAK